MSKYKLGEVCEFINGGAWSDKEYVFSGIPVLKVSNCKNSGFVLDELDYLPEESREKYSKNVLKKDDVIIATVGSHPNLKESAAGRSCVVNDSVAGFFLNQNAVCIRSINTSIVDQKYLGYLASSFPFQHYIQMRGRGAANQMRIAIGSIKEYEHSFPDIKIQKRITSILSSYDALIENNQKQIKLLEEAAQRLYKEWFIDLRFPGHESAPIRDGIPEGWERKSVEECLQMHINGGWGKESPEAKNCIPGRVIRGTDINDVKAGNLNDIPLRYHTENDVRKRALRQGDIIFELSNGNLANIGRTLFVDDLLLQYCGNPTICASFCKLFRPVDRLHALMLYWEIQDMQTSGRMLPYKKHGANGINNFDFEGFLNHMLLVPMSLEFVAPFDLVMQKESVIQHELMLLAEARDRLLPKLMSGEMEV